MDIFELAKIRCVVVPLEWFAHALGRIVGSSQYVLHVVLRSEVVQAGEEGMVLRRVQVRDLRPKERQLEVPHLKPVHNLSVEVQA